MRFSIIILFSNLIMGAGNWELGPGCCQTLPPLKTGKGKALWKHVLSDGIHVESCGFTTEITVVCCVKSEKSLGAQPLLTS